MTHGITCFWRQDPVHLDSAVYNLDSRNCEAEALWNVTAEAGKKTLVWHWPGSSWPPTSDSPNLHVVDGTQPATVNSGVARIEMEKIVLATTDVESVRYQPGVATNNGAGCVIEDVPETDEDSYGLAADITGGAMGMRNIILTQEDGEDATEAMPWDLCNSPIKEAEGWANAPEGAKEFYVVTSNGLVRRPCLILKNEAGLYDQVAMYHSKKDLEPFAVLEKDVFTCNIIDDYIHKDAVVQGNRDMRVMELAEDGSRVRIWMSKAFELGHDSLFHPKKLYEQVVAIDGPCPPNPYGGALQLEYVNKTLIPGWEHICQWQANVLNTLIQENDYQVVFSHLHNVDIMGHMFWFNAKNRVKMGRMEEEGYQDAIRQVYEQTDRYIGSFLHLLDEDWTIFIFSDHGLIITPEEEKPLIGDAFGCNVMVMQELGFTILKKDEQGNDLKEIDWEKTRAVATRGGHIYINLKGKYPTGIVEPCDQYELEREIIDALYSYRFEGKRAISVALRNKDAVVLGMGGPQCGDILYWLEEGINRLHGDSLPMTEGYYDSCVSPIFMSAGKGIKQGFQSPRVIRQADLAPTAAYMLGVRMPAQCEGAVVFQILEGNA